MRNLGSGRVRLLLPILAVMGMAGLAGTMSPVLAQDPPDLVPMGTDDQGPQFRFVVTNRLGGPTLEFSILTANIGGQDFVRPRDPDTGFYLVPQIYEYTLYLWDDTLEDWVEIDRRRKNTICMIDDTRRGRVFPCIMDHPTPRFTCGGQNGISRGWADDYFRNLAGQWVFIGDSVGWLLVQGELDPDYHLLRKDIPLNGTDATHDNNWVYALLYWDGVTLDFYEQYLTFDDAICAKE